ncbi:MAG: hypothetical protein ABIV21_05880 [Pyrinomonadaceae bacterium]
MKAVEKMNDEHKNSSGNYLKFFAMIGTSMVIMYLLTYKITLIENADFEAAEPI